MMKLVNIGYVTAYIFLKMLFLHFGGLMICLRKIKKIQPY